MHGDGFEILRSHDRAGAAASGVPAFIADGREANAVLSRSADGCYSEPVRALRRPDRSLGLGRALALQVLRVPSLHVSIGDREVDRRRRPAGDHDGIQARALQLQGKVAGRERIADEAGERRFGDDGKLRGRGEIGTDERRADEDQGVGRRQRLDSGRRMLVEQARPQADAAEKCAQAALGEIVPRGSALAQIDVQEPAVEPVHVSLPRPRRG